MNVLTTCMLTLPTPVHHQPTLTPTNIHKRTQTHRNIYKKIIKTPRNMPEAMNANELNPIMDKDILIMPDSEFNGEFTEDWDFSDPHVMTELFDSLFDVNTLKNAEEFLGIEIESLDKFIEEHDTPVDVVNCIEEMIQKLELKEIVEDVESELEMVPVEPVALASVQRRLSLEFNPLPDTCIDQCIDDIGDPFAEEEDQLVMSLPVPVERGDSMSSLTSQRPDSPVFDLEDKEPTGNDTAGTGDCWGCQNNIQNQMGHSCCGYASAEDADKSEDSESDTETVIVSDSDSDTDVEDTEDMLEDLRQQLREATVQIRKLQEANDYKGEQLRRLKRQREPESPVASPVTTTTTTATPPPVERSDTPPPAPKRRRVVARPNGRLGCAFCDWEFTGKHIKDAKFALRTHLTGLNCAVHPEHMHKTACTHTCAYANEGDLGHTFLLNIGFKNTQNIIHEHRKFQCTHCNRRFYNKRTCDAHIKRQHYKNI